MKDTRITIRLEEIDRARLELLAIKKDVPLAEVVRTALKNYIKESEKNGCGKPEDSSSK